MGLSIGKIASIASAINSKVNVGDLMSGINVNNVSADSLSSMKGSIESKLNSITSNITNELVSSISDGDIEGMIKNLDVESKVKSLMNNAGVENIDSSQIDSMVNEMINEFSLSNINSM